MTDLIPFLSYVVVMTFSPGPNNIMSMLNAGRHGIKKAYGFNAGIFAGFSIVMILCAIFSATLVTYLPIVKPYLTYIGAAYILYLAYKTFKSEYKSSEDNEDTSSSLYKFKDGFTLQFVNPKVILYGITIMSTFILPNYTSYAVLIGVAIGLAFVALAATSTWALFGASFHKLLQKHSKVVNIIMALLLVYTAVSLFL